MLTLERDSLTESLAELENTANPSKSDRTSANKIRARLSQINKRLSEISSVFKAEASAAAAKAAEAAEAAAEAQRKKDEAEAERRARLPPDTFLECRDCEEEFVFSGDDQDRFAQNGWNPPIRCADCRQARKDQRESGVVPEDRAPKFSAITICCKDCNGDFEFTVAMQKRFAKMDFAAPVRCDDCRQKKKDSAPKALLINCKDCHCDFSFSVGAQKHFAEMKWAQPSRCGDCRKLAAAKKPAANGTRSSNKSSK